MVMVALRPASARFRSCARAHSLALLLLLALAGLGVGRAFLAPCALALDPPGSPPPTSSSPQPGAPAPPTAPAAAAVPFAPGMRVLARWRIPTDDRHYPGTVERVAGGRVHVRFDDGSAAELPAAAVVPRSLRAGDWVATPDGPAVVVADGPGEQVSVRRLEAPDRARPRLVARADLQVLLRTDHGFPGAEAARPLPSAGTRVLARWEPGDWYVGMAVRVVGEAVWVEFADGSEKWVAGDQVYPLDRVRAGDPLLAINPMDGQPFPGTLVTLGETSARLRCFDGGEGDVPYERLVARLDQPQVDAGDPCREGGGSAAAAGAGAGAGDARPHARELWSWLTPRPHYYDDRAVDGEVRTDPTQLEIALVLFAPADRPEVPEWREKAGVLARQVGAFLARELGAEVKVEARALEQPVRGGRKLAWYVEHLREADAWHDWPPTAAGVRAAFPDGPRAGRHRVVVLLPDAPGIASDDSGVERGMGFVRMKGEWFARLSRAGMEAAERAPGKTVHGEWQPDFLATTIAHEVLHTIGLPHTDDDPWCVMNLGPWYPITRPEVHLARHHKLVLRSPFAHALGLAEGFALWLADARGGWLEAIRAHRPAATLARGLPLDTRLDLIYGEGPSLWGLEPVLSSFGPASRCRTGNREHRGERTLCRAYLASFVAFLLERGGPTLLGALRAVTDGAGAGAAARAAGVDVAALEREWHAWLARRLGEAVEPVGPAGPATGSAEGGDAAGRTGK